MAAAPHPLSRHLGSAVLLASLVLLSVAQEVLIPVALAALLAVLLTPVVGWVGRRGVPDLLAVLGVMGSALVVAAVTGWLILGQLNDLATRMPEYRDNLHHRLADLRDHGRSVTAVASTVQDLKAELDSATARPLKDEATKESANGSAKSPAPATGKAAEDGKTTTKTPAPPPQVVTIDDHHTPTLSDALGLATSTLRPVAIALLTVLLATFMIAQRADLHRRFVALAALMAGHGLHAISQHALDDVTGRITKYLVLQSLSNLAAGTIVGITLLICGLPNALLWGLLTGLLRFVPFIGILLAAGLTCMFAVAVSPDWSLPLLVLGLFAVVELLIGNVAEPLFFAHGTGLSTLAVLIATAFWTWIWGTAGLVLAIPLTVCLVALGQHVPSLGYLRILLSRDLPDDLPRPRAHAATTTAPPTTLTPSVSC